MRKSIRLTLLAIILIGLISLRPSIRAAAGCVINFDFTAGDGGWQQWNNHGSPGPAASYVMGSGWTSPGGGANEDQISIQIAGLGDITSASITFNSTFTGPAPVVYWAKNASEHFVAGGGQTTYTASVNDTFGGGDYFGWVTSVHAGGGTLSTFYIVAASFTIAGGDCGDDNPPPAASKYQPCPTQNDKGILPGTWTFAPPVTADPSGIGLDLNGGAIQKNFSLSRFHEYDITIAYKLSTAGPPEPFTFSFGKNFSIQLITSDTDTEDTVHLPASSYEPSASTAGADIYEADITAISPPGSPHLVITYFCLLDGTAGAVTGNGTGGAPQASCKDCTYEATGDLIGDILGVLKWIWCGLSQLWDCTIKSLFYGIWKFVGVIITALAFLRQWAGLIFNNASTWLGLVVPILWNFIRGLAGNIITTIFNALAGVFNALGITGIINAILAFLENIPGAISQFMSFIPGVVSLISTIWGFITYWVTTVWNLVSGILGAIPVVFASVVAGFNQSAAAIPVYAPTCNSSSTLFFGPCLGMYIIDNTVFDGPMYYVFPLVLGFVALNVIMWSIEKFKEALSGD